MTIFLCILTFSYGCSLILFTGEVHDELQDIDVSKPLRFLAMVLILMTGHKLARWVFIDHQYTSYLVGLILTAIIAIIPTSSLQK